MQYPRPPYSGATYFIDERGGQVICTKLEVCNKYDRCTAQYVKGVYQDPLDRQAGAPYAKRGAVPISHAKLPRHMCLTRFNLVGAP
ncbi:hypothetical protein [Ralstonia solanacearum]|uniref:Uncharacterized protein n=1 Tax=Ralstonia solanacearum (strain Po82) TaxID=1031711 RepID=F6G1H1_RALS8|nr:hypothetical protein [Ralstonia solanacearum]AEG69041.1 conserved hypothetical protein [Ralstonia solanacearum Po82]EUJ14875.1 hypothetical protein RSP673_08260 [Ralstonia solanacearum P673]MCG3575099.1 hypothetical protein [Ralstonia solanacearum]MCL9825724.1 hypothetical protein [Ralstonia solanacearum]MCL9830351.1 hypothetical protein [Ralstonia solanacearum]